MTLPFLGPALILMCIIHSSTAFAEPKKIPRPFFDRPCDSASLDAHIADGGLGHNSFDPFYRSPFGAVRTGEGAVTLRFRTCLNDVDRVSIRIWNAAERQETWQTLTREGQSFDDPMLGPVEFWRITIATPQTPTLLYYTFSASDHDITHYYTDDNIRTDGGGWGTARSARDDFSSYQITVYERNFAVPSWLKGKFVYQIFPDRFRNGDTKNDPANGTGFVFGQTYRFLEWNQPICDPNENGCRGEFGNQFYGGDLAGVIEKLDYLHDLGVGAIYLNPIFLASSNHRYDTADYYTIDTKLGDFNVFRRLIEEAKRRSIKIILDGVFNHMSADSPAFDLYHRWNAQGACESPDSPYRNWFIFPHITSPAGVPRTANEVQLCAGLGGSTTSYESWWGFFELPILNKAAPEVKQLFFANGDRSVGPWWVKQGTSGWRLDVGGDIDPGQASDPTNRFWEDFRSAVKAASPDAVIVGEEWGDASQWLTGWEWDSVMNYRFREVLLDWLADGCAGRGCLDGRTFEDNDNRHDRVNGPITPITESVFDNRLRSIQEDYPPESWHAMFNLLGSHDTNRILFLLKKISNEDEAIARRKFLFATLFQFTYPGAPTIYYGDEAGVKAEGKWVDDRWIDDPYARAVYPWEDKGLKPDRELISHVRRLAQIRQRSQALQSGGFETLQLDNRQRTFAFRRMDQESNVIVVLNRSLSKNKISLQIPSRSSRLRPLAEGAVLEDVLNGGTFTVTNGQIDCGSVPALWGRILVPR
jgi:glycosidase